MRGSSDTAAKIVVLLFLTLLLTEVKASSIKFYGDIEFEGLFYESDVASQGGCVNLPFGNDQTSSINTGGACVILYEDVNCAGRSLKVAPGVHSHNNLEKHDFNDKTSSFSICSSEESAKKVTHPQFSLYNNNWQDSLLVEYIDVCKCTNLPSFANDKVSSVNTHGHCIRLYDHDNCQGEMRELRLGGNADHGDLNSVGFNDRTSSINVCGDFPGCSRLNAIITKFRFTSNVHDLLRNGAPRRVELASTSTFRNNASTPITRVYQGSRTYRETYEFEQIKSLTHMHSVGVDWSIGVEGSVGIPFFAEGKIKTELKLAYQFQSTASSSSRNKYTSENGRTFSVAETFIVPPCTVYEVSSFMEVAENLPMDYELVIEVSGENHGRVMSAGEVKKALPRGLEYVENHSGTEVMAKTKGKIFANMGIKSEVESHGRKIQGCQERRKRRWS